MPIAGNLPKDESGATAQLFPARVAYEETYDASISTSTELTLNANTTLVRVVALGGAVALKWGTSDASTSDWDHVIPSGGVFDLEVPYSSGTTRYTALNVIEVDSGAAVAIGEF